MKGIWTVIYNQVTRVAKNPLQLPPEELYPPNGGAGALLTTASAAVEAPDTATWAQHSTCIPQKKGKKRKFTLETFFPINSIWMKEFQQPTGGWPTQGVGWREKMEADCCLWPCLPQLLPCDSSPCSRPGGGNYREKSTQGTEQPVISVDDICRGEKSQRAPWQILIIEERLIKQEMNFSPCSFFSC